MIREPIYPYNIILKRILATFFTPRTKSIFDEFSCFHGGIAGRSTLTCLLPHVKNKHFILVDLKDAFETPLNQFGLDALWDRRLYHSALNEATRTFEPISFDSPNLVGFFIEQIFEDLLTPYDSFPQGFPTSPFLFNLAMLRSDIDSCGHGIIYNPIRDSCDGKVTIFSDNMIISLKYHPPDIGKTIRTLVRSIEAKIRVKKERWDDDFISWKVNPRKVSYKVITPNQGVKVLGLVINDRGEINVSDNQLRGYRREIYDLVEALQTQQRHTPFNHRSLDDTVLKKYHRVMGILSYVDMVYSGQGRSIPYVIEKPSNDLFSVIY